MKNRLKKGSLLLINDLIFKIDYISYNKGKLVSLDVSHRINEYDKIHYSLIDLKDMYNVLGMP